jgi:predicted nucleic acid-binding protein
MKKDIILDTGPLVAYLSENDNYHDWAREQLKRISFPLLTCEAVITEASFLVQRNTGSSQIIVEMLQQGLLSIPFLLSEEVDTINELMQKYNNVPTSLADACLVRMAEIYSESEVLTLDSDFYIYRKYNKQQIPIIIPPDRFNKLKMP